LAWFL